MNYVKSHKVVVFLVLLGITYWAYKRLQNSGGVSPFQALFGGLHIGNWSLVGPTSKTVPTGGFVIPTGGYTG